MWRNPPTHTSVDIIIYVTMSSLVPPPPANTPPVPHDDPPPPRLRTLPSDKQIITPLYEAECTSIVHLVHNLRAHLRANSALVAQVEEILWDPTSGDFAQSYARWAPQQRRKSMRSRIIVIIDFYAVRHQLSAFPSATENLAKQMQDEIEAEAKSIHQRRDDEAREQEHRSAANALYEGALGALPAGYGNNGLFPVDASVAWAFSVLPSQPRSQNDVNNPVVAHQPAPRGDETPPPGGEAGVVAAVHCGGDGVAGALASPGGGVGVAAVLAPSGGRPAQRARAATAALQRQISGGGDGVAGALASRGGGDGVAAVLAPSGGRPAQRAHAVTAALQRQIAAGAAPTRRPTVISTGEEAQNRCIRAPDLNGTVISLNSLMDRARGMIETSIGGSRSVPESPNTKRQRVCTANIALLTGLLTPVRGMLVTQGMCTTAVDAQIQGLISEQANNI